VAVIERLGLEKTTSTDIISSRQGREDGVASYEYVARVTDMMVCQSRSQIVYGHRV
jgi:hypothetical protein